MTFYADLHVHSRHSRATSRDASLESFALWGRKKGLSVVGTGDITHPGWLAEIRERLVPAEAGLYRLRPDLERNVERSLPPALTEAGPVRFLLEVEIATIYKKAGATRKVHHLICVPSLDHADRLAGRLARIGNIASDGRPILGLDSRDLLEIALECGDGACLIPAHIWTPWFSALGSKSGFDAVDDCYGDLASHVFALETGLSSDPPMNWRVAGLDRFRLVSNSDAHSPAKLGREACVFDSALDYFAMRRALETGKGYAGTVEFFPEEGKYHVDGHRQCGARLEPAETRRLNGRCPVCGKPVTVGVMNRVEALADRPDGARPPGAAPFRRLIPLCEVLSELLGVGPDSGRVQAAYEGLLARLGPELAILNDLPAERIAEAGAPRLAEAIGRMRDGRVYCEAGYDGEYGVIRVFAPGELATDGRTGVLLDMPDATAPGPAPSEAKGKARTAGSGVKRKKRVQSSTASADASAAPALADAEAPARVRETQEPFAAVAPPTLDPDQLAAAEAGAGSLLIIAGPGTGKTRTLTHRIARLVSSHGAAPEQCLAITFTHRAAREMTERLAVLLGEVGERVPVMTFHGLGWQLVREYADRLGLPAAVRVADQAEIVRLLTKALATPERKAAQWAEGISRARRSGAAMPAGGEPWNVLARFETAKQRAGLVDFDDLLILPVRLLEQNADVLAACRDRFCWISVDEYQDVDEWQYRLVKLLVPPGGNLCAIGDPDQAIYGFRGADVRFFQRFLEDFPGARVCRLTRNYRSGRSIVEAALQVIRPATLVADRVLDALAADATRLTVHEAVTDRAEAEFVVRAIEEWIGGSTFFSMDSGRARAGAEGSYSFADFAVLYRTEAQAGTLVEALVRSGMPYQKRSHGRLAELPAVRAVIGQLDASQASPSDLAGRVEAALAALGAAGGQEDLPRAAPALRRLAARCGDLASFLSELALASDVDLWDPRADAISLLTLHAAKGLEFPVVFIAGCEDGLLPLQWGRERASADQVAEERRLFFVGMTRARQRLVLTRAIRRSWLGRVRETRPSPFLFEIEERLLERRRAEVRRQPAAQQLTLF